MVQSYTYPTGVSYTQEDHASAAVTFSWPAGKNLSLQEASDFYRDLSRALGIAGYLENAHRHSRTNEQKKLHELFKLEAEAAEA